MQEQKKQTLWRKLAPFKWRIIGGLLMLLVAILFLTIGFWKNIVQQQVKHMTGLQVVEVNMHVSDVMTAK